MWFLLVQRGRQVGFLQRRGSSELFSADGQSFSVQPIAHDRALPETPWRTSSGARIFDGDVVELRSSGESDFAERVVLVDGDGLRLGRPNASRTVSVAMAEGAPSIRARLGSVHAEAYYRRRYLAVVEGMEDAQEVGWRPAIAASAAALLGGGLSAAAQLGLSETVGPIGTMLGSGALVAVVLRAFAKRGRRWRHRALFLTSVRAGGLTALALGLGHAALFGFDRGLREIAVGALGFAVLGFLGVFVLVTILGNTFDHYGASAGE